MIARAAALTVLAMIAAAIGAGLGYAMLARWPPPHERERSHQRPPQTAVHASRHPADQALCPAMRADLLGQVSFGEHRHDLENSS